MAQHWAQGTTCGEVRAPSVAAKAQLLQPLCHDPLPESTNQTNTATLGGGDISETGRRICLLIFVLSMKRCLDFLSRDLSIHFG